MQIYNSHFMNNKERFLKSALYSFLCAIGCAVVFNYITQLSGQLLHITFPILYVVSGYLIAKSIHKAGGGIGRQYSYLGCGMTIFSILLAEMFAFGGYDILVHPQLWGITLRVMFQAWFSFSGNSILTLFFIAWGIYTGYHESDIANN